MLFIIYGWRGIKSTTGRGVFYCPSCEADRDYAHKTVRRFFTLYFIPVIPLNALGEYVECSGCKGTYKPEVLQWDPRKQQRAFEAEFEIAIRRVMVRMMLADGDVDPAEVDVICGVFQDITGKPCTPEMVREEARRSLAAQRALADVVGDVAPMLNDHGKEMVLRAAAFVAAADGRLQAEEVALLHEIGRHLELRDAQVQALLEPVRQRLAGARVA
jgi:tellurite resistance protein